MQIQAFHQKFTSETEPCNLFQALRQLSAVANFKSMFSADGTNADWISWPPVGVNATCEA
ncbi:MAG: hypothetical protein ACRD3W_03530 [Terriglobales bacterium]